MAQRGRPKNFDRKSALTKAMTLFWAKGYTDTQLAELTKVMGINAPSFYATFGSKKATFREAVELYVEEVSSQSMNALNEGTTLAQGLRAMLEMSVKTDTSQQAGGCLIIMGVVNQSTENTEEWHFLKSLREETYDLILKRIVRGQNEEEYLADVNVASLATFFYGIVQALSMQARDGASAEQLYAMVDIAMKIIET